MSIQHILDLVGKALPVERVNVSDTDYEPKLRVLRSIEWKVIDGARWLYWRWTPEMDGHRMDCGYSGRREDALLPESNANENCADLESNNDASYYQPAFSFES